MKKLNIFILILLIQCQMNEQKTRNYFIGDSHIARWDLNADFPGSENINLGVGGDVIEGVSRRIKSIDIKNDAGSQCFILVGTNNCLAMIYDGIERDSIVNEMISGYYKLLDSIPGGFDHVYVLSIFPTEKGYYPAGDEHVPYIYGKVNDSLRIMTRNRPKISFIDVSGPLTDKENYLKPDFTLDALHLNADGYRMLSQVVRQQMK